MALTISADVTNYNLKAATFIIGELGTWCRLGSLSSRSTAGSCLSGQLSASQYGFDTGSGTAIGTTLNLIMPGYGMRRNGRAAV